MTSTCLMTNCRNSAPSGEAMCARHRCRRAGGPTYNGKQSPEPEGAESFTPFDGNSITPCYTYDVNVTRNGNLIGVAEGWRGESFVTRIFDTREKATRDALIALGWTPPEATKDIYLSGYNSGFYSAGNYFPEQSWERYRDKTTA